MTIGAPRVPRGMGPGNRRAGGHTEPPGPFFVAGARNDPQGRCAMLAPPGHRVATPSRDDVTEDALFCGRLTLMQPARGAGYRTNVDAILLGAFAAAEHRRVKTAVDLGAGVGAVGLTLLYFDVAEKVVFIEKDP